MKIPVIAVIGGGQIGSRHLQALARLGRPARILVVDPNPQSLETALARFQEVDSAIGAGQPELYDGISALPEFLDVAIIATTANVRLEVLRLLLAKCRVKHLILEKVLFQSERDCVEAAKLLKEAETPAWVNCPKRLATIHIEVAQALTGQRPFEVRVSGSSWGLACNSVHFLDLIQFYAGQPEGLTLSGANLDQVTFRAKRPEFTEFSGCLDGRLNSDVRFSLTSYAAGKAPVMIHVDGPEARWVIVEDEPRFHGWWATASEGWEWRPISSALPYQSQLSHLFVGSILDTGACTLPTLESAIRVHTPLLRVLNRHLFGDSAGDDTICPIT